MNKARIIRGIGGFYTLLSEDGNTVECKARGKFRNDGISPIVGDIVEFEVKDTGYALIKDILPRKNEFVRPVVANIDLLAIVISARFPAPDWLLCDKLILQAKQNNAEPLIVLNKCDIADDDVLTAFRADYGKHFRTFEVSATAGDGLDALKQALCKQVTCFAGQSAVGKSSLINALLPGLSLETGGLTRKTDRGRHTTRKAELWPAFGGAILDTPGFSLFDSVLIDQNELNTLYPEFGSLFDSCRFPSCMHISEPGCAVKAALREGNISKGRYDRYTVLAKDLEHRRKHKYD